VGDDVAAQPACRLGCAATRDQLGDHVDRDRDRHEQRGDEDRSAGADVGHPPGLGHRAVDGPTDRCREGQRGRRPDDIERNQRHQPASCRAHGGAEQA
jgi:hypothetical protein